jgi:hypothetical protein
MDIETLKIVMPTATFVVAFGVGLWQYVTAQRWKRAEFAASVLKEIWSDPDLVACCSILDYPERRLTLEHRKNALVQQGKPPEPGSQNSTPAVTLVPVVLNHNQALMAAALRAPAEKTTPRTKPEFKDEEIVYRELFDRFFGHLAQVENCCALKLIDHGDVKSLYYWLERVIQPQYCEPADADVFGPYVIKYHPAVIRLAYRFCGSNMFSKEAQTRLHEWHKALPANERAGFDSAPVRSPATSAGAATPPAAG